MNLATLILQIVTITISVTSIVVNILLTRKENMKKHYLEIVTKQRIANKEAVRNAGTILLQMSNEAVLPYLDEHKLFDCSKANATISSVLKVLYKEDKEVLDASNSLLMSLRQYLELNKKDSSEVLKNRELFLKCLSIYDLADWRFIKSQSSGNTKNSQDFDKIYEDVKKNY